MTTDPAKVEQAVKVCPQCEGEGSYADGLDEAACSTDCTRCGTNGWIVDTKALAASLRPQAAGADAVERVAGSWAEVRSHLLSMCDQSNWPNEHLTNDERRGYSAAMDQVHQLAMDMFDDPKWIAALATPPASGVPAGWKLVPVELSREMIAAWGRSHLGTQFTDAEIAAMSDDEAEELAASLDWSAMLTAVPSPEQPTAQEEPTYRDRSRFQYFHDEEQPQLPNNCSGVMDITPTLQLIRERETPAQDAAAAVAAKLRRRVPDDLVTAYVETNLLLEAADTIEALRTRVTELEAEKAQAVADAYEDAANIAQDLVPNFRNSSGDSIVAKAIRARAVEKEGS